MPRKDLGDRMSPIALESLGVISCLMAIQALGVLSAVAARRSEGVAGRIAFQWLFIACLGLVGLSTAVLVNAASGWWLASGTTLSVMVLTITYD